MTHLRALVAGAALAISALPAGIAPAAALTAFIGATLIDGTGAVPVPDAVVLVEDGRITAAGPAASIPIPASAERVDLSGRWLLPGLIDAHIHFFQSGGAYARPDILDLRHVRPYADEIAAVQANLRATLGRYLASGITGVVDVGGPLWNFQVRALAGREAMAPRVAVAGPLLTPYIPPALISADPPMVLISNPAEARAEVRRQAAFAPDLIKIWFVRPATDLEPVMAWVRAAIDEAHLAGIRVGVHATDLAVATAVVEAGADLLVHSVQDRPVSAELLARMKENGVVYTPTFAVSEGYRRVLGLHADPGEFEARVGDPVVLESFRVLEAMAVDVHRGQLRRLEPQPVRAVRAGNLARVQDAGVIVAAGSDAGNIGTLHGPGLHRELELMVLAGGLTPMQAIIAATRGSATLMGREADLGTVAAGKHADFLVLDGDPLADIRNTRAIFRVVKAGVVYDPGDILAAVNLMSSPGQSAPTIQPR